MLALGLFSNKNFDILVRENLQIQTSSVIGDRVLAVIACDGSDPRSFLNDELNLLDSGEYHLIALASETFFEEKGDPSYSVLNSNGSFADQAERDALDESMIPIESQKALDIEVTLGCVLKGEAKDRFKELLSDDPERFASLLAVGGDPNDTDDSEEYLVHRLDFPKERGWTGISEDEIRSEGLAPFFCESSNYLDSEFKLPGYADQVTTKAICSELKDLVDSGELNEDLTKINYYRYLIVGNPEAFGELDESESGEYVGPMVVATFRNSDGLLASITWEEVTNWDFEE